MLLGTKLTTPGQTVKLNTKGLLNHTLVLGQSGSGKSFCIARLVEEILLRTRARVVVIDPNGDFRSLHEPSESIFDDTDAAQRFTVLSDLSSEQGMPIFDEKQAFNQEWSGRRFLSLTPGHSTTDDVGPNVLNRRLQIHWDRLDVEEQDFLLAIDPTDKPKLAAGVEACQEEARWDTESTFGNDLRGLNAIADSFRNQSIALEKYPAVKTLTADDWLAVGARFKELRRLYTVWHSRTLNTQRPLGLADYLAGGFKGRVESDSYWNVLTLSLDSARRDDSLLVVNLTLGQLWRLAKDGWRRRIASGSSLKDERVPTFIVVDEAHNFAPEETESEIGRQITDRLIQIASEGRKFGLYLILATQRPTKLHRSLVPECENSCVLRLQSKKELEFASMVLGIPDDDLKQVPKFEPGHALLSGRWVDGGVAPTFIAPARTVVGGGGLADDWLEPPNPTPPRKSVEERVVSVAIDMLRNSNRPIASGVLSGALLDEFDELEPGVWRGTGSFFNYLESLNIPFLRYDPVPPGYVWLQDVHDRLERRQPLIETGWDASEEASVVLVALNAKTHLPKLDQEGFQTVFSLLSAEVESAPFNIATVTRHIRDNSSDLAIPVGRQAANAIVRGIALAGHDYSTDLPQDAATLAEAYVRSQAYAMDQLDLAVSDATRAEVVRLVGGGLVDDEPVTQAPAEGPAASVWMQDDGLQMEPLPTAAPEGDNADSGDGEIQA